MELSKDKSPVFVDLLKIFKYTTSKQHGNHLTISSRLVIYISTLFFDGLISLLVEKCRKITALPFDSKDVIMLIHLAIVCYESKQLLLGCVF